MVLLDFPGVKHFPAINPPVADHVVIMPPGDAQDWWNAPNAVHLTIRSRSGVFVCIGSARDGLPLLPVRSLALVTSRLDQKKRAPGSGLRRQSFSRLRAGLAELGHTRLRPPVSDSLLKSDLLIHVRIPLWSGCDFDGLSSHRRVLSPSACLGSGPERSRHVA